MKFLGEKTVTFEGQEYKLVLNFNALCAAEEVHGINSSEVMVPPLTSTKIRTLMLAALVLNHPDASIELAGDIISSDVGIYAWVIKTVFEQEGDEPGKPKAPPTVKKERRARQ